MKTLKLNETKNIFDEFLLSVEEMMYVRGGDTEGDPLPPPPPVKI